MPNHPRLRNSLVTLTALPVLALAACADAPRLVAPDAGFAVEQAARAPVRLDFRKCQLDPDADPFVWEGKVEGDIEGNLTTVLKDARAAGPILHVRFDWIIEAGGQSFVADLRGILNTRTGKVVMNGRVSEGYLRGAQVHEAGQAVEGDWPDVPGSNCFAGTIRIMPATAR